MADRYLSYLKWKEFQRTRKSGLPASLPMERNMAEVQDTEVYKALLKMPKGGNLHSHEGACMQYISLPCVITFEFQCPHVLTVHLLNRPPTEQKETF